MPLADPSGAGPTIGGMNGAEAVRLELAAAEAEAWREYLAAIRGRAGQDYADLEPWAWVRLAARLRSIRARRGWLRRAAATA